MSIHVDRTLDLLPCSRNRRIVFDGLGLLLCTLLTASSWYGLAALALMR